MVGMAKRTLRILLGDRPVAYHPILARMMESAAGGIWLSQILYWDSVKAMSAEESGDEWDGWFYKSEPEIIQETALTRRECQTSKTHAKKIGIVETEVRGLPPTSHYRVNFDVMEQCIEHAFKSHTIARLKRTTPGEQSVHPHAQNIPQITQEITQENTGDSKTESPAQEIISDRQEAIVCTIYTNEQDNASTRIVQDDDEMTQPHYCGVCGGLLQAVRPGKWQCDTCDEKHIASTASHAGDKLPISPQTKAALNRVRKALAACQCGQWAGVSDPRQARREYRKRIGDAFAAVFRHDGASESDKGAAGKLFDLHFPEQRALEFLFHAANSGGERYRTARTKTGDGLNAYHVINDMDDWRKSGFQPFAKQQAGDAWDNVPRYKLVD